MNNNKISNTKVEVPKGTEMNDKDYINSVLSSLKEMSKNYTLAMTEASNEYLYEEYFNMFNNISKLQRDVYGVMFQKGWYSLEEAEEMKINQKLNMLTQEYNDLDE